MVTSPGLRPSTPQRSLPTAVPAPDVAQAISASVAPVLARCETLNTKVDRTHAKLAAGLRVNVNLLENIAKELAEVKDAIKSMVGNSAVLKAQNLDDTFPLKTTAEVEKYLEADPDSHLAMERSACNIIIARRNRQ